jgi:hypothetical protein
MKITVIKVVKIGDFIGASFWLQLLGAFAKL